MGVNHVFHNSNILIDSALTALLEINKISFYVKVHK